MAASRYEALAYVLLAFMEAIGADLMLVLDSFRTGTFKTKGNQVSRAYQRWNRTKETR
jgi:hypothetical protein